MGVASKMHRICFHKVQRKRREKTEQNTKTGTTVRSKRSPRRTSVLLYAEKRSRSCPKLYSETSKCVQSTDQLCFVEDASPPAATCPPGPEFPQKLSEALQHPLRIHGSSCALLIRAPCSSAAQRAPNPAQQTAEHPPLLQPRASINKTRPARTDPSAVHRHNSSFTSQKKQNNTRQSASSGGLGYFKSFTHPIEPPSAFRSRGGVSRLDARRPSASPSSLSTAGRSAVQSWRQPLVLGVRPDQLLTRHSSHVSHPLFRKPRPLTPPAPPPAPERSAAAQLAAAAVCSQPRRRNRLHTL